MLTEQGNIVISKKPVNAAEDYQLLRKTGLEYIQQFSGKIWTDHNLHDPGITILELLCYALTDLSYRTSFPVADLLTAEGNSGPDKRDFFTARKILSSHPVTIDDYKRLILDRIPGIRNVWFETLDGTDYTPAIYFDKKKAVTSLTVPPNPNEKLQLKGLYIVKLEAEDYATIKAQHPHYLKTLAKYRNKDSSITKDEAQASEYKTCLVNYVKKLLHESRNLCEDFEIIKVADVEWVAMCADIELKPDANADEIFLKINNVLFNYINPPLRFYSFKEMLGKGKRTEDIFNGPAATRGFIDEDEMNRNGRKDVLYVSDLVNLLMDIPGILQIKTIHLSSYKKNNDNSYTIIEDAKSFCLHLNDKANAAFQFIMDAAETDPKKFSNHIRFSKGLIYFPPKRRAEYKNFHFIYYPSLPKDFENDLPVPGGRNRKLLNYYSLQNDFPLCYYTGMDGIPNSETNLRKAQRLQSKAFLLFLDQLLADYLAGLNNLKNVFSFRGGASASTVVPLLLKSDEIKDLRKLVVSKHDADESVSDTTFFQNTYKKYSAVLETAQQQKQRRNRGLDHLLARFNELFVDYSMFKFQQNTKGDFFDGTKETIDDKIQFLKLYPIISSRRSHAANYSKTYYAASNTSGLQLRVQKMLGLAGSQNKHLVTALNSIDYKTLLKNMADPEKKPTDPEKLALHDNRFNSFDKNFGIHVLEHILLRPFYNRTTASLTKLLPLCGDGTNNQHADCLLADNYSFQMTVVAPGWLAISNHMDFRAFVENLIRVEAPAHAALKICWIDPAAMFLFEKTTEAFFSQMAKTKQWGATPLNADITAFNEALSDVNTMMGVLKNMYLPSNLDECENIKYNEDTDKINVPVILDHSALGADETELWYKFQNTSPFE